MRAYCVLISRSGRDPGRYAVTEALEPDHSEFAMTLNNLGYLYGVQGKWDYAAVLRRLKRASEAERFDRRAKLMPKQSTDTVLLDHAVSLGDLRKSKGRP